ASSRAGRVQRKTSAESPARSSARTVSASQFTPGNCTTATRAALTAAPSGARDAGRGTPRPFPLPDSHALLVPQLLQRRPARALQLGARPRPRLAARHAHAQLRPLAHGADGPGHEAPLARRLR